MSRGYIVVNVVKKPWAVEVPDWNPSDGFVPYMDAGELMTVADRAGSHFFSPDTMRWFRSRLHDIKAGGDGWYFITSEKHVSHYAGINEPRKYTVRRLSVTDDRSNILIDPISDFQAYPTLARARTGLKRFVAESRKAVQS